MDPKPGIWCPKLGECRQVADFKQCPHSRPQMCILYLELKTCYNPGIDQFLTVKLSRVWYSNCAGAFQPSLVSRSATRAAAIHRPLDL